MFFERPADERRMSDRRFEDRDFQSETVRVEWTDRNGQNRTASGLMNDISSSGGCLELSGPISVKTPLLITYSGGQLTGAVRYCRTHAARYRLGVAFDRGCCWSTGRPQLDSVGE
jgi:hypothetical protein